MPLNKVKFALIENKTDRKVSYKKRQIGFLKKAQELNILCDVEMAVIIYSPYNDEPKVFPNHGAAINTFVKFKELQTLERSKNMETGEEFTKKRIKKLKKKLLKLKKENWVKEITNEMYDVLNGKTISIDMNPYDLNDLSYVIEKTLKLVREAMKQNISDEGSTSYIPQFIVGPMIHGWTNTEGSRVPLFFLDVSTMIPQRDPSTDIPPMSSSMQMNNYQNYSSNIPQSPSLTALPNRNNDDVVTLLDDLSLNNINVQDPKHNNNI